MIYHHTGFKVALSHEHEPSLPQVFINCHLCDLTLFIVLDVNYNFNLTQQQKHKFSF